MWYSYFLRMWLYEITIHKVGTNILSWTETALMPGPLLHTMLPFKSVQITAPAVFIYCCHMHLKIKEEHKESIHNSRQLSQGIYTIQKGHLFAICKSQVKLNRSRKTANLKENGNYYG